ncbi:MAG: hypothetical protein AAB209_13545 [Bacteroidota bacterium]|jgi:hypothetical protein
MNSKRKKRDEIEVVILNPPANKAFKILSPRLAKKESADDIKKVIVDQKENDDN